MASPGTIPAKPDPALLPRIHRLLTASTHVRPDAGEVEDALTDGYARALALDAQRMELQGRVNELGAMALEPGVARELRALSLRIKRLSAELEDLRGLLSELKARA